jgi:hypothetical protein
MVMGHKHTYIQLCIPGETTLTLELQDFEAVRRLFAFRIVYFSDEATLSLLNVKV